MVHELGGIQGGLVVGGTNRGATYGIARGRNQVHHLLVVVLLRRHCGQHWASKGGGRSGGRAGCLRHQGRLCRVHLPWLRLPLEMLRSDFGDIIPICCVWARQEKRETCCHAGRVWGSAPSQAGPHHGRSPSCQSGPRPGRQPPGKERPQLLHRCRGAQGGEG